MQSAEGGSIVARPHTFSCGPVRVAFSILPDLISINEVGQTRTCFPLNFSVIYCKFRVHVGAAAYCIDSARVQCYISHSIQIMLLLITFFPATAIRFVTCSGLHRMSSFILPMHIFLVVCNDVFVTCDRNFGQPVHDVKDLLGVFSVGNQVGSRGAIALEKRIVMLEVWDGRWSSTTDGTTEIASIPDPDDIIGIQGEENYGNLYG